MAVATPVRPGRALTSETVLQTKRVVEAMALATTAGRRVVTTASAPLACTAWA